MFSFHMLTMTWVTDILFERLNLVSTIFYQTFTLSPMLALQKLQKNAFYFIKKALFILKIFKCWYFFAFWRLRVGGNYVWCLFIIVTFMGLGGAKKWEGRFYSHNMGRGGKPQRDKVGDGREMTLYTPCMDIHQTD